MNDKKTGIKGNAHRQHGHQHDAAGMSGVKLAWAIVLNFFITAVEIYGGVLSGSLALISDSVHNLSDAVSLLLSYAAIRISKKVRDRDRTYGYKRAQILAAFVNSCALIVISLFLIAEALKRFGRPEAINGNVMIIAAVMGIAANGFSAILLKKDSHSSMNIKSTYLHLVGDAFSSLGVVLGGIAIMKWGAQWVDGVITLLIAAYMIVEAYRILIKSVDILMQSSADINYEEIKRLIESMEEVRNIHHIHTWLADEHTIFFEAHVEVNDSITVRDTGVIYAKIERALVENFGISHMTIQIEGNKCREKDLFKLR